MRKPRVALAGQKIGKLTVLEHCGSEKGHSIWKCICDCGNEVVRTVRFIKRNGCCGRMCRDKAHKRRQERCRHGMTGTKIHRAWAAMRARCENPNNRAFKHYGGRGIAVCERWAIFENFLLDMGPSHKDDLELDRTNNELGYSPENCRWVSGKENNRNRRNSVIEGRILDLCDKNGISRYALRNRIKRGVDPERAASEKEIK